MTKRQSCGACGTICAFSKFAKLGRCGVDRVVNGHKEVDSNNLTKPVSGYIHEPPCSATTLYCFRRAPKITGVVRQSPGFGSFGANVRLVLHSTGT